MKKITFKLFLISLIAQISIFLGCGFCFQPDIAYKKELIKDSGNKDYKLQNMKSIVGEKELTKIIKKYDKHPEYYISDKNTKGDQLGVKELTYRAGLHSHTTFSDGKLTPLETLNQAAEYADKVKAKYPTEKYPMVIAITDHFNTAGCRDAIDIIQKNPQKYKNLKVVLGMETEAYLKMPSQKNTTRIHLLAWAINPYETPFDKMNFADAMAQFGKPYMELNFLPDHKDFIKQINAKKYGLVGIAHPLRYFDKDETIKPVISELFQEYPQLIKNNKILFTEGYYQPYKFSTTEDLYIYTIKEAKKYGIYSTGSQDTHGKNIFSNQ